MFTTPLKYSFEIYLLGQTIYFYASVPKQSEIFIRSLVTSSFPNARIIKTKDPLELVEQSSYMAVGEVALSSYYYLPLKTYRDFRDVDPLSSVLGFLARSGPS